MGKIREFNQHWKAKITANDPAPRILTVPNTDYGLYCTICHLPCAWSVKTMTRVVVAVLLKRRNIVDATAVQCWTAQTWIITVQ